MSRQSMAPARSLSLTEELEKLEQSITLTLQEIDHNFSKAHRIVTTSILPVVEQYAKHSDTVREGSKFWKQFFEASANVSLSSYEETAPAAGDEESLQDTTTTEASTVTDDAYATPSTRGDEDETITGVIDAKARNRRENAGASGEQHVQDEEDEEDSSLLDSPSVAAAHSTPRAMRTTSRSSNKKPDMTRRPSSSPSKSPTRFAEYPSPYEVLKREMRSKGEGSKASSNAKKNSNDTPVTPGRASRGASASRRQHRLPDTSMTPDSSPFADMDATKTTAAGTAGKYHATAAATGRAGATAPGLTPAGKVRSGRPQDTDPLLHRMLDRTFRVQATPHKNGPQLVAPNSSNAKTKGFSNFPNITTPATARRKQRNWRSPDVNEAAFLDSPDEDEPPRLRPELFSSPLKTTPGVSVYTTAAAIAAKSAKARSNNRTTPGTAGTAAETAAAWQSDSDDEDVMAGISPPKTIQFSVPQSKLLQTPAREASRRIVEDLLLTAGADFTDSIVGDDDVVRPGMSINRHGDNSDVDIDVDADADADADAGHGDGDAKHWESRGGDGGGRIGRRVNMAMNTPIDDSPSIVRKKGLETDDEF